MSSAFHARCGAQPGAAALWARLSAAEQGEVSAWRPPACAVIDGRELHWADARREERVEISNITAGHPDGYWLVGEGVIVGDLKRSSWTTPDGPASLQLLAYGYGLAAQHGCAWFRTGVWSLTEGGWQWGDKVEMGTIQAACIFERIAAAALSDPAQFATGPHCSHCYARSHCREYLLPVADPEGALAPLAHAGGITADNFVAARRLYERAAVYLEAVKKGLDGFLEQHGPVPSEDGRLVLRQVVSKGAPSLDRAALERDHPELVRSYLRPAAPRSGGYRWCKR